MEFPIHTMATAPEASRTTLEATAKRYGFLPNFYGVLAESPTAVQAYAAINQALEQSVLSAVEQQVVSLTVSATNSCAYCMGAHSTVAQMVRMPEHILRELRVQQPLSDRKLDALLTLVLSWSIGAGCRSKTSSTLWRRAIPGSISWTSSRFSR